MNNTDKGLEHRMLLITAFQVNIQVFISPVLGSALNCSGEVCSR